MTSDMKNLTTPNRSAQGMVVLCLILSVIGLPACQHVVKPWQDDFADAPAVTTPSEDRIRSQSGSPSHHVRAFAKAETAAHDGSVTHWPLWWEDPFEDRGSDDGKFAVTSEDYVAMPYVWGRHLVNLFGFPISVWAQPPWQPMTSDGYTSKQALGYDHDPTEWVEDSTSVAEAG